MKFKKKILLILCIVLSFGMLSSGCGNKEQITLRRAIENTQKIKSGTSDLDLIIKMTNEASVVPINVDINVTGNFLKESKEKIKFDGNMNFNIPDMAISFETPLIIDTKDPEDVDLFFQLPKMYAQILGTSEEQDMVYLNTKEMKDLIPEEQRVNNKVNIKAYEKIGTEFFRVLDEFKGENEGVIVFKEIKNKRVDENGIYEFNFTKENSINFLTKLFEDQGFVSAFKEITINNAKGPKISPESIQEAINEITTDSENLKKLNYNGKIKIEKKIINTIELDFTLDNGKNNMDVSYKAGYSNVNQKLEINIPDKNADNIFNLNEKLSEQKKEN